MQPEPLKPDDPFGLRRQAAAPQGSAGASRVPVKPGMREDVFTLDEGDVIFQWPENLSKESFEDLEGWMQIQLRKIKRRVVEEN